MIGFGRGRPWLPYRGSPALLSLFLLGASASGCEKKSPPDSHVTKGYQLLPKDPGAAYEEFRQARQQSAPQVLLGTGLALEQLRRFAEAEPFLEKAAELLKGPQGDAASLALVRVRIAQEKSDKAREAVDRVAGSDRPKIAVLVIEAMLANDAARATRALVHLDAWQARALDRQAKSAKVPAELYLAQAMLARQLEKRPEYATATRRARLAKLDDTGQVLPLVEMALKTQRHQLASALLRKLEEHGVPEATRRVIARVALALGDLKLAGDVLATLQGDDGEVLALRGEYEFAMGEVEAIVTLRRALASIKRSEDRRRLWTLLAEALLRRGHVEAAREEAEKLAAQFSSDQAVLILARLDLVEDRPDEALKRLEPLLGEERKSSAAAREFAARAHVQLEQFDAARKLFDAVLLENPRLLRAARLRIALEFADGRPEVAVDVAKGLVRAAPDSTELKILLAGALSKVEGEEAAISSLEEGARAHPDDVALRMELVDALQRAGRPDAAFAELEKAHREQPEQPAYAAALASRLAARGDAERAARLYEEVIQSVEHDPVASNNLAMLYADELGDPERAVELAEGAYRLLPRPAIADTLGWALYLRGKPKDLERARKLLESVQSKFSDPSFQTHWGAVLLATGESEEGKRILRRALAHPDEFPEAERARQLLLDAP